MKPNNNNKKRIQVPIYLTSILDSFYVADIVSSKKGESISINIETVYKIDPSIQEDTDLLKRTDACVYQFLEKGEAELREFLKYQLSARSTRYLLYASYFYYYYESYNKQEETYKKAISEVKKIDQEHYEMIHQGLQKRLQRFISQAGLVIEAEKEAAGLSEEPRIEGRASRAAQNNMDPRDGSIARVEMVDRNQTQVSIGGHFFDLTWQDNITRTSGNQIINVSLANSYMEGSDVIALQYPDGSENITFQFQENIIDNGIHINANINLLQPRLDPTHSMIYDLLKRLAPHATEENPITLEFTDLIDQLGMWDLEYDPYIHRHARLRHKDQIYGPWPFDSPV